MELDLEDAWLVAVVTFVVKVVVLLVLWAVIAKYF